MNGQDPYATPLSPLEGVGSGVPMGNVTLGTLEALQATKPWVRFMGVMGWIGVGLMVVLGLVVFFASVMTQDRGIPAAVGLLYLVLAGLYVPPTLFLHRYASRIGDLLGSNDAGDLEEALRAQKSFWKYVGILMAVTLAIYALVIVGMIIFAAMAAKSRIGG